MRFYRLFPILSLVVCGCTSIAGSALQSSYSREEAIRLYNGGIAHEEWTEALGTMSRPFPQPDTYSIQLSDGFLFYKTDVKDGEEWVVEVIPTADAPEELKILAQSFKPTIEPPPNVRLDGNVLTLNGVQVSNAAFSSELVRLSKLPKTQRPIVRLHIGKSTLAADSAKLGEQLKAHGLQVQVIYE